MKSVVITGSSRGIGYGLAHALLERGCQVTLNGRSQASVEQARDSLCAHHDPARTAGQAGDVTRPEDQQALWDRAMAAFGKVDVWINNAGIGHPMYKAWQVPIETVHQVIDVNLKGVIFGAQVATRGMLAQGFGHIYNMEGFGSNGRVRPGLSIYGTSKAAVRFFSHSLTKELEKTPVQVSTLSPGIVITDLLMDQLEHDPDHLEEAKSVFNALGDKVETVTPWLADQILSNEKSGAKIDWLPRTKVIQRFATAPFNRRDLFS